ncbi:hypothetical protein ACIHCV_08040 [Streptomyces sp. NPDC051956]|uniref:hypothetical protein n=1 Tax=Streptomyces sp. NPDC051956 TaxID=3365677 RepID=UPI0037D63538
MDSTVLGAVIGLAGISIGAGGAFAGVVYQQRHAARAAEGAQRRAEALEAAAEILNELLTLQQLFRRGEHSNALRQPAGPRRARPTQDDGRGPR